MAGAWEVVAQLAKQSNMCLAGTEAQMRAALHAHILCWFRPRRSNAPVQPAVKRTAPGAEPKQRPRAQQVEPLADEDYREDNMYQNADVARVSRRWCGHMCGLQPTAFLGEASAGPIFG